MQSSNHHSRMLIIGLDGATSKVLDQMREAGALPHIGGLTNRGVSGLLRSTIPTNSAAAWVSFMTGKNPGKHGVFEFQVRPSHGPQKIIASSRCIDGETLWQILSRHGLRVVVINVPITYPPQPVNGAMVSGIPLPSGSQTWAYPQSLIGDLDRVVDGYAIGTPWRYFLGRVKPFLEDLTSTTWKRARAARYLMERYEPDVTAVVFVGPDRLQHCLWQYLDPNHTRYREQEARAHRGVIQDYFFELDRAVGDLLAAVGDDTTVVVLSDHGFQAAEKQLDLNEWLAQRGMLRFRHAGLWPLLEPLRQMENRIALRLRHWWHGNAPPRFRGLSSRLGIDWPQTRAYAPWGFQEGVSVNLAGREPDGTVEPGTKYDELRAQLQAELQALRDPETGRRVVREVWLREECYRGPHVDLAADVVLVAEEGFSTSPAPGRRMLFRSTGWVSGCHHRDGILIVAGKGIRQGRFEPGPAIQDIAPTVLHLLGLPIPDDMDGHVLDEVYAPEWAALTPQRFEKTMESVGAEAADIFSEEETRDLREKLRGLGYLG